MQDHAHRHDATQDDLSDAPRGDAPETRRPGELIFSACLVVGSVILLVNAYGISGFDALSGAGSVPMATAAVMLVSVAIIFFRTMLLSKTKDETVMKNITPPLVIFLVFLLIAYGLLLNRLGFLPTSALFLVVSIKLLAKRGWGFALLVSLGSLAAIYLVFRIAFSVLMPAGIVPEAEVLQLLRNLFTGAA